MTGLERRVRALAYRHILDRRFGPTAEDLAVASGETVEDVREALHSLRDQHLLAFDDEGDLVVMAHPFSGVETGYRSRVAGDWWYANCAWDSLAILALLGDGQAEIEDLGRRLEWSVVEGQVEPEGAMVHLLVPAARFWDDIGFT